MYLSVLITEYEFQGLKNVGLDAGICPLEGAHIDIEKSGYCDRIEQLTKKDG